MNLMAQVVLLLFQTSTDLSEQQPPYLYMPMNEPLTARERRVGIVTDVTCSSEKCTESLYPGQVKSSIYIESQQRIPVPVSARDSWEWEGAADWWLAGSVVSRWRGPGLSGRVQYIQIYWHLYWEKV